MISTTDKSMVTGIGEVRLKGCVVMISSFCSFHKNEMQRSSRLFILQQSFPINLSLIMRNVNTMNIISIIVSAEPGRISALSGRLGRIEGISSKAMQAQVKPGASS